MVEIIASDFGVELVTQKDQNSFLAAPKGVLFYCVFLQKNTEDTMKSNNFMCIVMK